MRAILRTRPQGDAASHHAALALHGAPLFGLDLSTVDVCSPVQHVTSSSGLVVHPLPDEAPLVRTGDSRVVATALAVLQTIARRGVEPGLVVTDWALHQGRCTMEELESLTHLIDGRWRRRLQTVLGLADPACESPGESRTRLLLHSLGVPYRSQAVIHSAQGSVVARVDFLLWERVVLEFDGLLKYEGHDGKAALAAEKRREDAIRALGYVVVRLTWADLARPARLLPLLLRARAQAQRSSRVGA